MIGLSKTALQVISEKQLKVIKGIAIYLVSLPLELRCIFQKWRTGPDQFQQKGPGTQR